jgi:hypothetical protein
LVYGADLRPEGPFVRVASDDVDDAAHCAGAVDRRRAAADNLDSFDVVQRDSVPEDAAAAGFIGDHAVDEDECSGLFAEAAQAESGQVRAKAAGGVKEREARLRAQQVAEGE